jgi:hypothetical protein
MKHVITYPGFAEGLNAKGLYPAIKTEFPQHTFHMLPFYEELPNGNRVIHSIEEHRDILQTYMDGLHGQIIILVKCGGNRVITAMDKEHVSLVDTFVSFNSPWGSSKKGLEERFEGWRGIKQPDGSWLIPRDEDNTCYYVATNGYMEDATAINLVDGYNELANNPSTQLYMVRGLNDKIIPPLDAEKVPGATFIDIEGGDHHLRGVSRSLAISALAEYRVL